MRRGHIRMQRTMSILLAAATILLAGLLIWQCVDIYREGTSARNMTEEGVRIHDIYSREIAAERLSRISWAVWVWLAALIAAIVERAVKPVDRKKNPGTPPDNKRKRKIVRGVALSSKNADNGSAVTVVRIMLTAAALALIALGIGNGGMWDVLVKAINICTECVGLG